MQNSKTFFVVVSAALLMVLSACKTEDPKTDLVQISKELADKSRDKSDGVGRSPKVVELSDRQFTYVDIPEAVRAAPYYLDFDIFRDSATVWTQADIDCEGCDPEVKKARAQKWDLKVSEGRISLNTNNLDDTGKTIQSMAATEYLEPIIGFEQAINLNNIEFRQQTSTTQSQIDANSLFDTTTGNVGVNNAWMIRPSSGKRMVYFQFIDYDIQGKWLLFHIREQRLDQPNSVFKPPQKIYIKWSKEAQGQGKVTLYPSGKLFAYFDFDRCFPDDGPGKCFTGAGSDLRDVISEKPTEGWDFYYSTNILTLAGGITKLNGGWSRDPFNNGVDVAALNLGTVKQGYRNSFGYTIKDLWGFSSFDEFQDQAIDSKRYKQTALGTDGNNAFYNALWYQTDNKDGKLTLVPNNRIYILETTEGEGIGLQFVELDNQGRISRIEYKGLSVKQPRKFDIYFRQQSQKTKYEMVNFVNFNVGGGYTPIVALQDEIVDGDGNPLSDEEFSQLRFNVATLCHSGGVTVKIEESSITEAKAKQISQPDYPVTKRNLTRSVGVDGAFVPGPIVMSITARQPGKNPVVWQVGMCFSESGQSACPKDGASNWQGQLRCD